MLLGIVLAEAEFQTAEELVCGWPRGLVESNDWPRTTLADVGSPLTPGAVFWRADVLGGRFAVSLFSELGMLHSPIATSRSSLVVLAFCSAVSAACGSNGSDSNGSGGGGSIMLGGGSTTGMGGATLGTDGPYTLPAGYTKSELGGWKLGDAFDGDKPPASATSGNSGDCGNTILAVIRDFNGKSDPNGHPDFEAFEGTGPTLGLVKAALGSDQKPVYAGNCATSGKTSACPYGQQTTTKANFDEWYRYTANVDKPYVLYLSLEPSNGALTFQSHAYFPLDGTGWGNQQRAHNFHFTTEIHTQFQYNGGETFRFIGDDDVWVFLNNKLALDLGGLHSEQTGSVLLDEVAKTLGLSKGKIYPLDLFHAERHTQQSNFRVDTNLRFTNCGEIVPEPPVR